MNHDAIAQSHLRVDGDVREKATVLTDGYVRAHNASLLRCVSLRLFRRLHDYGSFFDRNVLCKLCFWIDHSGGVNSCRWLVRDIEPLRCARRCQARLHSNQDRLCVRAVSCELSRDHRTGS